MFEPLGLSRIDLAIIKKILLKILDSKKIYHVYVFGSRAHGKFRTYSDLDLLLESSPEVTGDELATLRADFEDSELAIKIDLVTSENRLPEYRERIESERQLWF